MKSGSSEQARRQDQVRKCSLLFLQGDWWLVAWPRQRGSDHGSSPALCCFSPAASVLGEHSHVLTS